HFLPEGDAILGAHGSMPLAGFYVRPEYFHVAGIPLKEGRLLTREDGKGGPAVAVISDNVAARFWPGQSAIGQRFRTHPTEPAITIVGVVPYVRTITFARD